MTTTTTTDLTRYAILVYVSETRHRGGEEGLREECQILFDAFAGLQSRSAGSVRIRAEEPTGEDRLLHRVPYSLEAFTAPVWSGLRRADIDAAVARGATLGIAAR